MPDDLRLQLLGGAELEGQLKEGQPEDGEEKMRHALPSVPKGDGYSSLDKAHKHI